MAISEKVGTRVLFENDRARVWEQRLAPGESLPGHVHRLPYFYVVYLTILLVDRSGRDDVRCRQKYGPYWDEYCRRVPSKIIPGIY